MCDSNVVIRVEGLGKKYALHHQRDENSSFRDVLVDKAHSAKRLLNPFTLAGQLRKAQRDAAKERIESEEEFWALRNVSFEITRGERVGFIGRNGAGKSTLLKILSRITEPTTGRVEIRGRVASLLEVGTGFHPELTGRENIYLNGAILGMKRREIQSKFSEIVEFAEISRFLDTPVKRYSSGMYVRLAFAVAAHLEPELLVVDEVLAVGDVSFQEKCLGKMEGVAREGRTVLFVSHNLQAIERLCDRALYLKGGECVFDGTSTDACASYLKEGKAWKAMLSQRNREYAKGMAAQITNVEVLDSNLNPAESARAGEAIFIRIHYATTKPMTSPWFGISVLSQNGVRIFNSVSADLNNDIDQIEGEGSVEVCFSNLILSPGHYLMNIALGMQDGNYLDYIAEIPMIDIVDSPALPSIRSYNQKNGLVFVPAKWTAIQSH